MVTFGLLNRKAEGGESVPDTARSTGPGKVMSCETGVFFCSAVGASLQLFTVRHKHPNTNTDSERRLLQNLKIAD